MLSLYAYYVISSRLLLCRRRILNVIEGGVTRFRIRIIEAVTIQFSGSGMVRGEQGFGGIVGQATAIVFYARHDRAGVALRIGRIKVVAAWIVCEARVIHVLIGILGITYKCNPRAIVSVVVVLALFVTVIVISRRSFSSIRNPTYNVKAVGGWLLCVSGWSIGRDQRN